MQRYKSVFNNTKALIGMIHLNGSSDTDVVKRAMHEARLYELNGYDGIIVENYFGSTSNVEGVLKLLRTADIKIKVGVNILGNTRLAFKMSELYELDFLQVDSVSGHLRPQDEKQFEESLNELRSKAQAALLGGVRFKYQPILSTRSEHEDIIIAKNRCDAIVVTSDATGQETPIEKIERFRQSLGIDFPLIVGAGLTANNISSQFKYADAGIVGSWVKSGHTADGELQPDYLEDLKNSLSQHTNK